MNITELQAKVRSLEKELQESRELLARSTHDAEAFTRELCRTRAFAFSAETLSADEVIDGCVGSLDRYGFCVIDNLIPSSEVAAVCDEVKEAHVTIDRNMKAIKDVIRSAGREEPSLSDALNAADGVELRRVRRVNHPPKPPNDIVWMPRYAQHLANPLVTGVARRVLDDHLRIGQLHIRMVDTDKPDGAPGGFGPVSRRGRPEARGWHTDWPHDLSAYGNRDAGRNAGCIRLPFPDIPMCLVMIWYLTDVDASSGGTWVVPGSHRDRRNPRGPSDGITTSAPIPGDMQVTAPAGSVYIQDSRSWHATPLHNSSGRDRVAVVNRWCPWWLSVDDYAPRSVDNAVCRPLSHDEYRALPVDLQPLMRHLCPDEQDTLQQPVLDRAWVAHQRTLSGLRKMEESPDSLADANAHIRVPVMPTEQR